MTLVYMSTCKSPYYCGRQCYAYNNGAVTVCQTSYANAGQFALVIDSLYALYGSGTYFLADSVIVSGTSQNAENSVIHQLEEQGYVCN